MLPYSPVGDIAAAVIAVSTVIAGAWRYAIRPAKRKISSAIARVREALDQITAQGERLELVINRLAVHDVFLQRSADAAGEVLVEYDAGGRCTRVNGRWTQLTGLSAARSQGSGWVSALHDDDRDRVLDEWVCAYADGRESFIEFRLRNVDSGSVAHVRAHAMPVRNPSGKVVGYLESARVTHFHPTGGGRYAIATE